MEPNQPASLPTQPVPQSPVPPPPAEQKTDTLGIISIIIPFVGLSLIGLVLGLVGASRAKKENRSPILSRVGWIVSLVLMVISTLIIGLVFLATPSLQKNAKDSQSKTELLKISAELDAFHATNKFYPPTLDSIKTMPPSASTPAPTYIVSPEGCTQCQSYRLQTTLKNGQTFEVNSDQ